ncbi:MAG: hypothetical protein HRK26_05050 [Rickettsiaceae bacterium H1]|nr:hypothetical protein [Rickettsiaceae bacterium H1]
MDDSLHRFVFLSYIGMLLIINYSVAEISDKENCGKIMASINVMATVIVNNLALAALWFIVDKFAFRHDNITDLKIAAILSVGFL